MLKVYINEEEVVANQNFTIQKHMLNTPSVVLNNVCPKSWCENKDYTTNFYHPLDYSKCKIQDEIYHPEVPGETITTNNTASITGVDTTKQVELANIEGNTTQSGTPTPSTPQAINVVSGSQNITVCGKNLFNPTIQEGTYNQTTYTIDSDGKINQSSTDNSAWSNTQKRCFYLEAGTYTIKIFGKDANQRLQLRNLTDNTDIINTINDTRTFTLTDKKLVALKTYGSSGYPVSYYIELEKGEITTPTYEQYKGQTYEINLGKNLINLTDGTYDNNGITAVVNNGEITLNGTVTSSTSFITIPLLTEIYLGNANKTLSLNNSQTISDTSTECRLYTSGQDYNSVNFSITNGTRTFSNDRVYTRLQIRSSVGVSYNNFVFKPQLEKGSEATSYSAYKTPIELCKIGDYKDRIYKDNGTWYIEKQIGKVVLDGSEGWGYSSGSTQPFRLVVDNIKSITQYETPLILTNYFTNFIWGALTKPDYGITHNAKTIAIRNKDNLTDLATFKTWLSTHNTIVYYVLDTPTITEITDTELINQLNAIQLLSGINNITISSQDLTGNYTIHYNYKDAYTAIDLLFCGVVKNSGNISLNPREPHYSSLQILDFKTFLSEGETLDYVIYQKTILEAIQQVIGTISDYGFVLGNVNILNPNDIIGAYSTKDKTAYDVFNYIADITQSRWTTRLVDENTVAIDFYDPALMPQGTAIDYNSTFFENNLINDMKYSYGTNNYRNKQVMTSSQVYSNISQTQTIVANGYQTQFPTEQPIGKIVSITANNIPMTFSTYNEKEMGYVADFYYNPGDNYFDSDDLRSTGEIIIIEYVAIIEGRQVITNATEIDRINETTGRKGIVARYENRNDATTSTELQKIGESYIKYKGTPEIKLTIQSRKNTWEVGQRVQFNAPIDELDTEYMVRTKKINYIANQQDNTGALFYTYELISSFNSETEINYFDNQRAKANGNIGEGEYISRNIDIESTAEIIFYDTESTEVVVDGDNTLNAILNSPFIS